MSPLLVSCTVDLHNSLSMLCSVSVHTKLLVCEESIFDDYFNYYHAEVLLSCEEVRDNLNVIRVFSKAIENKDYKGSNYHPGVFRKTNTDGECEEDYAEYALHHIIRQRFPVILKKERRFKQLEREGKVPSDEMRREFRSLVFNAETTVLKGSVDIVLCTCNEASSHRITNSLKPVYLIVDECAMSTEPESMVPIRLASNVVLIGDHNQLQPVIQNQEAKDMGLGISLFERYASVLDKQGKEPHLLQEQYRMVCNGVEMYGSRFERCLLTCTLHSCRPCVSFLQRSFIWEN